MGTWGSPSTRFLASPRNDRIKAVNDKMERIGNAFSSEKTIIPTESGRIVKLSTDCPATLRVSALSCGI